MRKINIKGKNIEYKIMRRRRTRCMRLAIYPDGAFVVTAPKWYPVYAINRFIGEKADWIFEKLKHIDFRELQKKKNADKIEYEKQKKLARTAIGNRVEFFNRYYNFTYNRISVKNQKSCWGSCSRKGNLNFSYKIIKLPEEQRDYVVVHELCHLRELNHSSKFWDLVAETTPEYKKIKKALKNINVNQ